MNKIDKIKNNKRVIQIYRHITKIVKPPYMYKNTKFVYI